ncbi:MAG: M20/M25/M40 family metallo-hydrolase [Planctomycetes bacterium]|nr:M20/M25/M40 family metallo-hydrolase [Planctomycetota bacterium]
MRAPILFRGLALLVLALPRPAQETPAAAPDLAARCRALFARALEDNQSHAILADLCARAPKRMSGTTGYAAAVEWGRQKMIELGFQNVRLEPCMVPHWERGEPEELALAAPSAFAGEKLAVIALGGSVATPPTGLVARVVEFKGLGDLKANGARARGAIAFLNQPLDPTEVDTFRAYGKAVGQRWAGAMEAARAGAVAVVVRSMTLRLDDHPHSGSMGYADDVPKIPAAAISTRAAERLSALLGAGHAIELRLVMHCMTYPDKPSFNVVGELVGRERPDEILVVGGHLDAWDAGSGAHDDGAGCAQALEALRLIRVLGLGPRRTLRCVLFANEEFGTRGGNAYAEQHRDELPKHVLALESDRGGFLPRGFEGTLSAEARARLDPLYAALAFAQITHWEPGDGGVDIGPMKPAGVPLVGLVPDSQRYFDVHHAATDVIENVHPRELALGAAAMAALLHYVDGLDQSLR